MPGIQADEPLRAILESLEHPVEFRDASGRILAYAISPKLFERITQLEEDRKALYAWANSLVSDEELRATEAEGGEFTFEEVMEKVGQITSSTQAKSA